MAQKSIRIPSMDEKGLAGMMYFFNLMLRNRNCQKMNKKLEGVIKIVFSTLENNSDDAEKEKYFQEFINISKDKGISASDIHKIISSYIGEIQKAKKPDNVFLESLACSVRRIGKHMMSQRTL